MTEGPLDVLVRGIDSSGRPIKATRQNFQFTDRLKLVVPVLTIVQGSFSFADASANTHGLAMCKDYRTWNLFNSQIDELTILGRDLMGTMWYRTREDGFDPHFHNNLIGDGPATASALSQVADYRRGLNGLANKRADRNPYRPKRIRNYIYLEDELMASADDILAAIEESKKDIIQRIAGSEKRERGRDQRDEKREKARFRRLVTQRGQDADAIGVLLRRTPDKSMQQELRKMQEKILLELKEDPDVTEEDNPTDDGLAERNLG